MKKNSLKIVAAIALNLALTGSALAGGRSDGGDQSPSGFKWRCTSADGLVSVGMQASNDLAGLEVFSVMSSKGAALYQTNARLIVENGQLAYSASGTLMSQPEGQATEPQFELKVRLGSQDGQYSGSLHALDSQGNDLRADLNCRIVEIKRLDD